MVQQTTESTMSRHEQGTDDRQPPIAAKKTALRELQNQNRIIPRAPNVSKTHPLKDQVGIVDPTKLCGAKRPSTELSENPSSCNQSPSSNAANSHLVYVRRKSDSEGRSSTGDSTLISLHCSESISAVTPLPITSSSPPPVSSTPKPSVPSPLGLSVIKLESLDSQPIASSSLLRENSHGMKNLQWEERFMKLQQLLRNLDQADHKDYIKMLNSLPSVDLSWHAVELERRSIQLSLEEAKEMQRVGLLNVLGKSMKK